MPSRRRQEIIDLQSQCGDGGWRERYASNIDINPKPNNGEAFTRFLLFVIPRASKLVPQEQKLDLLSLTQAAPEENDLVVEVASEIVIHINMEGGEVQFLYPKPVHKA